MKERAFDLEDRLIKETNDLISIFVASLKTASKGDA